DPLDLDTDDRLGVGALEVIRKAIAAVATVDAGAVDAAQATGMELGPGQEVRHLAGAPDHRGHDPAGPGLEHAHDAGVIGGGHPHETVDAAAPGCPGSLLDLGGAQAGVLMVEPDTVEAAAPGDELDDLGRAELSQCEDLD